MDVGFVVPGGLDGRSGGYRYDRKLCDYLEAQGDRVEVIDSHPSVRRWPREVCSRQLRARLDRPFDVLLQDGLAFRSLWRHNSRLEHPGAVVGLLHMLASYDASGLRGTGRRLLERRFLATLDGLLATSRHIERAATHLADRPSTVAYPAGRTEGAVRDPESVAPVTDRPLRVLFVGTIRKHKGPLLLIDALEGIDCDVGLVGEPDGKPEYVKQVRHRADASGATVWGALDGEQLTERYRWADVLAVPSQYEGFGMVYLEAMEHGVVPIASARGGASELVEDGVNGLLVQPRVDAVSQALTRLDADRDLHARLAHGALQTAATHPGWAESMERVRSFLCSVSDTVPNEERAASRPAGGTR